MGSEYPDVLGDLVDARRRFEVKGVHYVAKLEPALIAPGEATSLQVWLQSCWDMPLQVAITIRFPHSSTSPMSVIQARTDVPLKPAEVGQLTIPVACSPEAMSAEYTITAAFDVSYEVRGLYVRSQKNEGQLGDTLLNFATGMDLAKTVGLGFVARSQPEQALRLHVEGPPKSGLSHDLTPVFRSLWTVEDLPVLGKARQLVNDQRLFLLPQLSRQALYLGFLEESQERFRDAQLPLHIGESVFLAKVLTYTAEYFLKELNGQDMLLVPAYGLAIRHTLPTNDPVFLVVRADYARMVRLAMSLSFGLLRRQLGRDVWTMEEQIALTDFVAGRLEQGGSLPAEFLYLPLLLGALIVTGEVQMPGENVAQSLQLLAKARQQRTPDLSENPELNVVLDRLLQQANAAA